MPTLNELFAQIAELNPDPKEFATGLQSTFQPGFQEVFERGHKTKASDAKKEIATLKKDLEDKDAEIERLAGELETAGKGTADVEKVRSEYKTEITNLKTKHKADLETKDAEFRDATVARVMSDLRSSLIAEGMFEIHADAYRDNSEYRSRVRPGEKGSFEILKEAGSEVAIQSADGKPETALRVLLDEIKAKAPSGFFGSKVAKGAGSKTEDGTGRGKGTVADRIRTREAEKKEARKATAPKPGALLERMGVPKPA